VRAQQASFFGTGPRLTSPPVTVSEAHPWWRRVGLGNLCIG
jgi:hypothetical protein